jgi:PKD repeat protein
MELLEARELLSSNLVAAYNFDAGSGTTLTDLSGNGNNGTITNAQWTSAGKYGGALIFNGSLDSLVTAPGSVSLNLINGMTLEAWVKPTSLNSPNQGWCSAIAKEHLNSSNDVSYSLYAAEGAGTPPGVQLLVNGNDQGPQAAAVLPLGQWTFLSATYNGSVANFYVNGQLVASQSLSGSITTTNDPLTIGGDWSGEMFTGLIDNVRVYNTALSQAGIQTDMNTPVGAATSPPVANAGPNETAAEGTAITFAGSVTGGTAPLTYAWAFGDGGTATGSLTPSHTYAEAGTYKATLTVTDSAGQTSTSSDTVTVTDVTPTAKAGGPYSGIAGTAMNFSGSATDSPADTPGLKYAWAFGDGGTSTAQNPSHTYATAGTYTATLTVTDPDGLSATASAAVTVTATTTQPFPNNGNPPPLPAPTGTVINVSTVSQLQAAAANLQSGQTILIAPGTYKLAGTLYVPQGLSNIAIRGATGKAGDVVLQGDAVLDPAAPYSGSAIWGAGSGISGTLPFGIWLGNVQGVTVADLTIQDFVDDAVILNAGVQSPLIHDVVMLDTGEQLLKSNPDGSGGGVNNGVVEYCTIGYTTAAPNNYTNGIDIHTTQNWVIRDNLFKNILTTNPVTTLGPGALAGPAFLVWNGSKNATVTGNTFVNCQREIAFGLSDPSTITDDNTGGLIANNMIYRSGGQHGDVAIGVWNSPNTEAAYNTVILNGDYVNAIEYRFATTTGVKILYNLTDAAITQRDSASATVTGNVTSGAQPAWFVNEGVGNLHLTAAATGAIGKGVYLPEVGTDYDGQARPSGGPTDVGADEYEAAPAAPAVSDLNWSASGDGITGPTAVATQTGFTISRTCNVAGQAAPGSFTISYYASASSDPKQDLSQATLLGSETLSAAADLAAGNHSGTSPSFQLSRTGSYYLFAKLATTNFAETDAANDTNNLAEAPSAVTVTGATIVDNGTAGYSETGTWRTESVSGAYGGTDRYASSTSGSNSATWQVTGLAAGSYTVQASWNAVANEATDAPYALYDGSTLLSTVLVDQTQKASGPSYGGVPFQTLATVTVTSGTLKVVLSNTGTNHSYLIADAVRVAALPASATDLNWTAPGAGISGPTSAVTQTNFTVSRTYNVGGQAAPGGFTISYYASASSDPKQDLSKATLLGTETLSAAADLAAGNHAGSSPSFQFNAPGTYYLFARLAAATFAESDAANDTNDLAEAAGSVTVTGGTIIDNGTAGYSDSGSWHTESDGGAYGGTDRYASAAGNGNNTATWQLTGLASGSYTVQASWNAVANEATNAPYALYDGSTLLTTVLVDQTKKASGPSYGGVPFQALATVTVSSGTLKVVLSNTNTNNTYIIADAVRVAPAGASAGPNESAPEGTAVTFAGSVSGGAAPFTYSWSFGDGGTATGSLTPSHTYAEAGTYTATLTVTDSAGQTSSSSDTVTATEVQPTAKAGGPYTGTAGTAIAFAGSATDSPVDTPSLKYAWAFGDSGTSTAQNPSHSYTATGTFTVTLTVTDADGLTAKAYATATVSQAGGTPNEPLLYRANLQYVGAFRVPAVPDQLTSGVNTYDYGGTALAFNPADNGLFLVGMPYDQAISELAIPQSIVNSTSLDALATAKVLQQPVAVLPKLPNDPLTGTVDIGGLMVDNGQLVGTAYEFYDAAGTATYSHFTLGSLNLATAAVHGLYQVGNLGAGLVAGYMVPIPAEWQAALGAPYLTGQADLNIVSRTSSGPAAFGFDPGTLGSGVTPTTPYVYYPVNNPLGPYEGPADPLQSGTTQVNGAAFVPGTNSVLFFGSTGTNYDGYGEASTYGDTVRTAKGPHSLNGQYALQVWAYNAADLVAVKQGKLQPWQVQPYDVWNFTVPIPSTQVGGVAFDAASGRLYVSVLNADTEAPYSSLPLIEVFQVTLTPPGGGQTGGGQTAAPQVGTLAATPSTQAPGPVSAGTAVTLTAGNVYAINPGDYVTQVAFYVDTNHDGVLERGTDQLLGYGTVSTIPNAGHNWTLTFSTSGMAAGTYTLFAQALDANGLFSDPLATTLTVL